MQLLDSGKRSIILNILRKQHGSKNLTAPIVSEDMKPDQAVDDEVEILDMDEPKMGKYKRKRSKFLLGEFIYLFIYSFFRV